MSHDVTSVRPCQGCSRPVYTYASNDKPALCRSCAAEETASHGRKYQVGLSFGELLDAAERLREHWAK